MSIDTPTATRLLEEALLAQGYHGLYTDHIDDPCCCRIGDLFLCGMEPLGCRAGWLQPTDADDDFRIGPTPPVTAADLEALGQQRLIGLADEETQ